MAGVHRLQAGLEHHPMCGTCCPTPSRSSAPHVPPMYTFCNFLQLPAQNVDQVGLNVQNRQSRTSTRFTVGRYSLRRSARRSSSFCSVSQNSTIIQALLRCQFPEWIKLYFLVISGIFRESSGITGFNSFSSSRRQEDCSRDSFDDISPLFSSFPMFRGAITRR